MTRTIAKLDYSGLNLEFWALGQTKAELWRCDEKQTESGLMLQTISPFLSAKHFTL